MDDNWSNNDEIHSNFVFDSLHYGLTVDLIATPRLSLFTCNPKDSVVDIMELFIEYSFP